MMKISNSVVLASAILCGTLIWWFGFRDDTPKVIKSSIGSTHNSAAMQSSAQPDDEAYERGDIPAEEQPSLAARRIVQVPLGKSSTAVNDPATDNLSFPTPENLAAYGKQNLDAALAGDLTAGYRVGQILNRCFSMPKTVESVEINVIGRTRALENAREQGVVFKPTLRTEAEHRSELLGWAEACLRQDDLFNRKLKEQLDRLANEGHVIARYLFAVWPPEFLGKDDAFLIHQEWSSRATEYSMLNLEQRELAGMLAFAQSYSDIALFTTQDSNLGTAFYMAALECGFEEMMVEARIENFFNSERNWEHREDVRPQVLAMAEGLKEFCD